MQVSSLAKKIAEIIQEVTHVEKEGRNDFHKYNYVMESTLLEIIRLPLAKRNVVFMTSIESQETTVHVVKDKDREKTNFLTKVTTLHTLIDGDSGEQFQFKSQGQGIDSGDKGVYKAITGALKYAIYKTFLLPSGDDPEQDHGHAHQSSKQTTREYPLKEGSQVQSKPTFKRVQPLKKQEPKEEVEEVQMDKETLVGALDMKLQESGVDPKWLHEKCIREKMYPEEINTLIDAPLSTLSRLVKHFDKKVVPAWNIEKKYWKAS